MARHAVKYRIQEADAPVRHLIQQRGNTIELRRDKAGATEAGIPVAAKEYQVTRVWVSVQGEIRHIASGKARRQIGPVLRPDRARKIREIEQTLAGGAFLDPLDMFLVTGQIFIDAHAATPTHREGQTVVATERGVIGIKITLQVIPAPGPVLRDGHGSVSVRLHAGQGDAASGSDEGR